MLRANFFYRFFKYKQNTENHILKYNSNKKFDVEKQINDKILEIDQKIAENSNDLIQAQIVRLRSTFSKSANFLEKIGENVYKTKLEESIKWHQNQLKDLYLERRELQINMEKIKGISWLNRIKRFLGIIFVGILILISIFIFLSGFMIIIYLLPLLLLIFFGYLLSTRRY